MMIKFDKVWLEEEAFSSNSQADWLSSLLPTCNSPTQLNGTHADSFRDSSAGLRFSTCPTSIQNTRLIVLQRLFQAE